MQERVRLAFGGLPSVGAGRAPDTWIEAPSGEVGAIADAVAGRSFLYEDPGSFRAGILEVLRALVAAGLVPQRLPA
jgi:hypothetical protein